MTDETTKKSKSLGSIAVAKLAKDPKAGWKGFEAASEKFKTAKAELATAKNKVRDYIKKTANLDDDMVIDFVRVGDDIQVTQNLQPPKREKASDLDQLF